MPIPLIWLLLAGGAAVALAARPSKKRGQLGAGEALKPGVRPQMSVAEQLQIKLSLGQFGVGGAQEYPAPYRYQDATKIADLVLKATSETSGDKTRPHYEVIRDRAATIHAADSSKMPNAYKTYALVWTVVLPAIASNIFYNWYRPRSAQRKKIYAGVAAWALMFNALPETATANAGIRREGALLGAGSYILGGWGDYISPLGKLVTDLSPRETRGLLNDLAWYFITWPRELYPDSDWAINLEHAAEPRMADWYVAYPQTGSEASIVEGNFELVGLLLWWATTRVEMEIEVDFDEGAAWAALVVKTLAALASGAAAVVSPAVAAIVAAAAGAVQGLAIAFADGELSSQEMQALGGVSVALALKVAGVDLGLNQDLERIEALMG